jgi:hypothetical protein
MHPLLKLHALRASGAFQTLGVALVCLLVGAQSALADTDVPATDTRYDVRVDVGLGRFEGKYGLDDSTTVDVLNLSARWYLPRGEVQVSLPYLRLDGPADIRFVSGVPAIGPGAGDDEVREQRSESGIGDIVLKGEYYLMSGTTTRPWVIGLLRVKLPTGDEDRGLSTGATDYEAGVGLIQRVGTAHLLADAGYTWVGDTSDFDLRNVLRLGAGVSRSFGPDDRRNAYVYLENRTNTLRGKNDRRSVSFGLGASLGEQLRTRLSASLFIGLSNTAEDIGLYLTAGRRY